MLIHFNSSMIKHIPLKKDEVIAHFISTHFTLFYLFRTTIHIRIRTQCVRSVVCHLQFHRLVLARLHPGGVYLTMILASRRYLLDQNKSVALCWCVYFPIWVSTGKWHCNFLHRWVRDEFVTWTHYSFIFTFAVFVHELFSDIHIQIHMEWNFIIASHIFFVRSKMIIIFYSDTHVFHTHNLSDYCTDNGASQCQIVDRV